MAKRIEPDIGGRRAGEPPRTHRGIGHPLDPPDRAGIDERDTRRHAENGRLPSGIASNRLGA